MSKSVSALDIINQFTGADTIFVMTHTNEGTVLTVSFDGKTVEDTKLFVTSEEEGESSEQAFDFIEDFEETAKEDFEEQGKTLPIRLFAGEDETGDYFVYAYYDAEKLPESITAKEEVDLIVDNRGYEVDDIALDIFYTKNDEANDGFFTYTLNN